MEELTTPNTVDKDVVTPAENWFLYWKTSPSLWESKLRSYSGPNPIFIPIYWALHSEYSEHYDFGQVKPETNLKKLSEIAKEIGKELVFLVQLTPVPFLINGGIPSYLARSISINKHGMAISCFDYQNRINRIYSFYDPRVFQAYRKFVWNLNQYFRNNQINYSIFGLKSYRIEDNHIVNYFMDHSKMFEDGFHRYLQQLQKSEPNEINSLKENPAYEKELKNKYSQLIAKLYDDSAQEVFDSKWSGSISTCFLGGGSLDLFRRSQDKWESQRDYFNPLMKSMVNGYYPSSLLLDYEQKSSAFGKALQDLVSTSYVQSHLNKDFYEDELNLTFQPLVFFEVIDSGNGFFNIEDKLDNSGLKYFFGANFAWSYKISREEKFNIEDMNPQKIRFYFGERLTLNQLNSIIKLFLNGFKVFIDIDEIPESLYQRLQSFFIENSISLEKLNYITNIEKASLGDGMIITYDSRKLKETSLLKRAGFWEKIFKYLEVKNLQVQTEENVEYFWKVRSSNTYELNYEEIRRVSFYNPSSYKRKAKVHSSTNFALIKSLDQVNVEVKSTPIGIDVLLLPGGSVSLDFGYYEA